MEALHHGAIAPHLLAQLHLVPRRRRTARQVRLIHQAAAQAALTEAVAPTGLVAVAAMEEALATSLARWEPTSSAFLRGSRRHLGHLRALAAKPPAQLMLAEQPLALGLALHRRRQHPHRPLRRLTVRERRALAPRAATLPAALVAVEEEEAAV